jgi:hypothetical protein
MNDFAEFRMPRSYPYTEHDGHFIVDTGEQRWLLDTGSPVSVGSARIKLGGASSQPLQNFMGVTIDWLQEMVGTEFDALVGMDVLRHKSFMIDAELGQVHFGLRAAQVNGLKHTFYTTMGIPTVELSIAAEYCALFFDTGAKITYLAKNYLDTLDDPLREIQDFYPGLGQFTAQVYETHVNFGDDETFIEAALLPEQLDALLDVATVEGILGNDSWNYGSVYCSGPEQKIIFEAELTKSAKASLQENLS